MSSNFIQKQGPFKKGEPITFNSNIFKRFGIQAPRHVTDSNKIVINNVTINGKNFEIGKTGILEYKDVEIQSLSFPYDQTSLTTIDYIIEEGE